jgi:hypothetical protein
VNDRVVLEGRRKGEERRRGAVRFIGPLENTESTDIYIGVELDTASELVCVFMVCVNIWHSHHHDKCDSNTKDTGK